MSNTEMVSFPRELSDELAELIAERARVCGGGAFEIWEAICEGFGKPVEPNQGEPAALPERMVHADTREHDAPVEIHNATVAGWNACLDEIAKLGPLYTHPAPAVQQEPVAYRQRFICPEEGPSSWVLTESNILTGRPGWEVVPLYVHADPGEVEQGYDHTAVEGLVNRNNELREERDALRAQLETITKNRDTAKRQQGVVNTLECEAADLRAKLAEAQALLREVDPAYRAPGLIPMATLINKIDAALSASAEPSSMAARIKSAVCPKCSSHPCVCEELSAPADGVKGNSVSEDCRTFVTVDGKPVPITAIYDSAPVEREKVPDFNLDSPGPHITIEGCNFIGGNACGTPVFEYEGEGAILNLRAFTLKGWTCYGPGFERDERADFESYAITSAWLGLGREEEMARDGEGYAETEVHTAWDAWQARAALERKPS